MLKKTLIILTLLLGAWGYSEVYLLAPWSGARGGYFSVASLNGSRKLLSEPVSYNGVNTELTVYVVESSLSELLDELRARLKSITPQNTPGGVAIALKAERGWRKILLLFGSEFQRRVTVFEMSLPEKMPKVFDWPSPLPLPANAKVVTVMEFKKSGSCLGVFSNGADRRDMMLELSSALYGRGFYPQTGESAVSDESYGELFVKGNPLEVLQLKLNDFGEGMLFLHKKN